MMIFIPRDVSLGDISRPGQGEIRIEFSATMAAVRTQLISLINELLCATKENDRNRNVSLNDRKLFKTPEHSVVLFGIDSSP